MQSLSGPQACWTCLIADACTYLAHHGLGNTTTVTSTITITVIITVTYITIISIIITLQMSPVKIDGAKRQLFSLAKSHNLKLQEAALKRRKSPSPDANPIDAQTAAAEEAAEEAGAAHSVKDKAEQQAAGTGKKTKAVKKETSRDEEAVQGSGKARLVKRKRKDDAEPKVMQGHPHVRLAMTIQSCMWCDYMLYVCCSFQPSSLLAGDVCLLLSSLSIKSDARIWQQQHLCR